MRDFIYLIISVLILLAIIIICCLSIKSPMFLFALFPAICLAGIYGAFLKQYFHDKRSKK